MSLTVCKYSCFFSEHVPGNVDSDEEDQIEPSLHQYSSCADVINALHIENTLLLIILLFTTIPYGASYNTWPLLPLSICLNKRNNYIIYT